MHSHRLVQIGSVLAIAACVLLVGCGVSGVAGTTNGTAASATATATACQPTSVAATGSSRDLVMERVNQEPVGVTTDRCQYEGSDAIVVTITNNLASTIYVTDHHTDCSVIILQKDVNGIWSNQVRCPSGILTRNIPIQPHSTLRQTLHPSQGYGAALSWPSGTYRLYLPYATKAGAASSTAQTFSTTFTIA